MARLASAAWLASCAPLALPWCFDDGVERFAGVSFAALAALPWLFAAGLPRPAGRPPAPRAELWTLGLALPPLGAAAGLDAAQGASFARLAALLAVVLASGALLASAARRAADGRRAPAVHALAWSALVALPPLAVFALEHGGGPFLGRAPAWLALLDRWSPLGWLARAVHDVRADLAAPWGALVASAIVLAAVGIVRSREVRG